MIRKQAPYVLGFPNLFMVICFSFHLKGLQIPAAGKFPQGCFGDLLVDLLEDFRKMSGDVLDGFVLGFLWRNMFGFGGLE